MIGTSVYATRRSTLLDDHVTVLELCTPLSEVLSVPLGPIDGALIAALREKRYDQAAVRSIGSQKRTTWGLVDVDYLERLLADGLELEEDDDQIRYNDSHLVVDTEGLVDLLELLERMRDRRALLVIEQYVDEDGARDSVQGLLTISDLNRHALRGVVYRLLAMVEAGLAALLEKEVADTWAWIRILNEEDQARVLGYWEVSKRKGVDIGPTAATTLVQLLKVFEKRSLFSHLDMCRADFKELTSGIPRLRNNVMHPVRPLVLAQGDVETLHSVVGHLRTLRSRLHAMGHVKH